MQLRALEMTPVQMAQIQRGGCLQGFTAQKFNQTLADSAVGVKRLHGRGNEESGEEGSAETEKAAGLECHRQVDGLRLTGNS
jgi:hypothetical protein